MDKTTASFETFEVVAPHCLRQWLRPDLCAGCFEPWAKVNRSKELRGLCEDCCQIAVINERRHVARVSLYSAEPANLEEHFKKLREEGFI